jgi:hypothetical protein
MKKIYIYEGNKDYKQGENDTILNGIEITKNLIIKKQRKMGADSRYLFELWQGIFYFAVTFSCIGLIISSGIFIIQNPITTQTCTVLFFIFFSFFILWITIPEMITLFILAVLFYIFPNVKDDWWDITKKGCILSGTIEDVHHEGNETLIKYKFKTPFKYEAKAGEYITKLRQDLEIGDEVIVLFAHEDLHIIL